MPVAVVTGASRGIGKAVALQLASDGIDVAINDIQLQSKALGEVKREIEAVGAYYGLAYLKKINVEADVQQMVNEVAEHFGELNIMIANAGIIVPKKLLEVSVEEWDRVQSVNVRGAFLCYCEAAKQMIKQGKGGKIIGACSIAAFKPSGNTLPYSVSKYAVRGLTVNVAMELAQYGINVNAYCPGPVDTDMWREISASMEEREGIPKEAAFDRSVQSRSAMKRAQTPEDIAATVSFLASDKARNITGQCIIVDGGIVF